MGWHWVALIVLAHSVKHYTPYEAVEQTLNIDFNF